MRLLKVAAMVLGIMGGYLGLQSGPASATPFNPGVTPLAQSETPLVAKAQWGHRRGWGGGYRRGWGGGYRRHWGGYGYRRGYYGWGGPRYCSWRYTPWGPRRVCWRRW